MKLLRYFAAAAVILGASFTSRADFRYGAEAGVGLTNLSFKQDIVDVTGAVGPRLGVTGEMMFPGLGFGLRLGALYTMNGAKMDLGSRWMWQSQGYGKEHVMLHTLELPVNLEFKWTKMNGFEDTLAPFVFGGPVFTFNIAHSKCKTMQFPFGSVGLRAGIGAEILRRWQVTGAYTWGMTYTIKARQLQDYSARNRFWSVGVTYFF